MAPLTWREATQQALYGDGGFYRREGTTEGPAAHFRTSVHASPLFAQAVLDLAKRCGLETVVDVGSGRGELLIQLHAVDPSLRLIGIEVAPRPAELPPAIDWMPELPERVPSRGSALLIANEWLDNVPLDVAVLTEAGVRLIVVDPATGLEGIGDAPSADDRAWLDLWWPLTEVGDRAEIGCPRDAMWSKAVGAVGSGVAVAIDYCHSRAERPPGGSLSGYRHGHQVLPVPDGSCDITTAVALDACAAAGRRAGARGTWLTTQRKVLLALGLAAPLPDYELSQSEPKRYVEALKTFSQLSELTRVGGLGDFGWLIQSVGVDLPADLAHELGQLEA